MSTYTVYYHRSLTNCLIVEDADTGERRIRETLLFAPITAEEFADMQPYRTPRLPGYELLLLPVPDYAARFLGCEGPRGADLADHPSLLAWAGIRRARSRNVR